jgi:hypothetical protein
MAEAALATGDHARARVHANTADQLRADGGFVIPPALRPRAAALRQALAG